MKEIRNGHAKVSDGHNDLTNSYAARERFGEKVTGGQYNRYGSKIRRGKSYKHQ